MAKLGSEIPLHNYPNDKQTSTIASSSATTTSKATITSVTKNFLNLEKSTPLTTIDSNNSNANLDIHFNPNGKYLLQRLIINLVIESIVSLIIYYNYPTLTSIHYFLGPTLLGSSTAALAQSINQYIKKKYSLNKIFKFMVWGLLNGYFTVLWIDVLFFRIDSNLSRIIVDQFIGAPIFQLIFNVLNSLWDTGELSANTRAAFIKSLKYSYCFWPIFSICSFVFIPKSVLFPANCLANLLWNVILSKLA
ncbi:hypothetical protein DFJ63DRAFT_320918 [Scheffersomyces coipomensis]|uniref:uncharacterized protein n=1 Tax=Scheffersomyces coipomensis TaxID=1788519 RepID=UPI00315D676D